MRKTLGDRKSGVQATAPNLTWPHMPDRQGLYYHLVAGCGRAASMRMEATGHIYGTGRQLQYDACRAHEGGGGGDSDIATNNEDGWKPHFFDHSFSGMAPST